jgi:hypothetical protein
MTTGNDRLRGSGLLLLLGGIAFLGTSFPAACNHGGGLAPTDAGASGGANGGAPADGPGTGGADAQISDGPPADVPVDAAGGSSAGAGASGTATGGSGGGEGGKLGGGGSGGEGGKRGGGGTAGGDVVAAGAPDLPSGTGGRAQGGAAGGAPGAPGDGSVGGNGGATDGGAPDVMFPCGPCSTHWVCGGAGDAGYTDVILTVEDDGCYLSGLPGHKLLAPDGTITEAGSPVARAQKFGPQVGLYYPDGSQWLYCGGNLPCSP